MTSEKWMNFDTCSTFIFGASFVMEIPHQRYNRSLTNIEALTCDLFVRITQSDQIRRKNLQRIHNRKETTDNRPELYNEEYVCVYDEVER